LVWSRPATAVDQCFLAFCVLINGCSASTSPTGAGGFFSPLFTTTHRVSILPLSNISNSFSRFILSLCSPLVNRRPFSPIRLFSLSLHIFYILYFLGRKSRRHSFWDKAGRGFSLILGQTHQTYCLSCSLYFLTVGICWDLLGKSPHRAPIGSINIQREKLKLYQTVNGFVAWYIYISGCVKFGKNSANL
jgi:hypothetical protein